MPREPTSPALDPKSTCGPTAAKGITPVNRGTPITPIDRPALEGTLATLFPGQQTRSSPVPDSQAADQKAKGPSELGRLGAPSVPPELHRNLLHKPWTTETEASLQRPCQMGGPSAAACACGHTPPWRWASGWLPGGKETRAAPPGQARQQRGEDVEGGLELLCSLVKERQESNRTNRANNGRVSEDRSSKATLLLTAPRSSQVVCKGSTPVRRVELRCARTQGMFLSPDEPGLSVIG